MCHCRTAFLLIETQLTKFAASLALYDMTAITYLAQHGRSRTPSANVCSGVQGSVAMLVEKAKGVII
jgi:hypothetical protein